MFLTKLSLDPQNRQVQSEIANRYELHRTLTAQFPNKKREDIGLLYRIEMPDSYHILPITLLIQTQLQPDWGNIEKRGILTEPPQVKTFSPTFSIGDVFYFRVLGNPTVKRKRLGDMGKRIGLYTNDEQQGWILRKAKFGGFQIQSLQIADLGLIESIKVKNDQTFQIKHLAVRFEGILKVAGPSKFHTTLEKGIGSAKAFGFGLLSLAK